VARATDEASAPRAPRAESMTRRMGAPFRARWRSDASAPRGGFDERQVRGADETRGAVGGRIDSARDAARAASASWAWEEWARAISARRSTPARRRSKGAP
jgi:hypothetical protein